MPAQKTLTHLGVAASACLLMLAGCRSDSGSRPGESFSGYRPRPTVIDQPAPTYSAQDGLSVQFALARTLEGEKNWKGAEAVYLRILEQNPKHADAAHRLAILCDRQSRFKESDKYFRQALKARPGDPNLFCDIGYSCYRQRRWADAEMNLKQATAIEKSHARAHNHLGLLYAQLDRRKDALTEFTLSGCSKSQAHTNVALVLSLNDRLEEAQQEYVAALNVDPTSDEVRSRLQKIESVLAMSKPAVPQQTQKPQVQMARHSAPLPGRTPPVATVNHANVQRSQPAAVPTPLPPVQTWKPIVTKPAPTVAQSRQQPANRSPIATRSIPTPVASPWDTPSAPRQPERVVPRPTTDRQPGTGVNNAPTPKGRVRLIPEELPELKILPLDSGKDDRRAAPKDGFRPFGAASSRNRTSNPPQGPARGVSAASRPVDNGLRPISHESPAKSDFDPGTHLQPIGKTRQTRSPSSNGLIDLESIVSPNSVNRPKRVVIE